MGITLPEISLEQPLERLVVPDYAATFFPAKVSILLVCSRKPTFLTMVMDGLCMDEFLVDCKTHGSDCSEDQMDESEVYIIVQDSHLWLFEPRCFGLIRTNPTFLFTAFRTG